MIRAALVYIASLLQLPILWAGVVGVFGLNFIFNGVDQLIQPANSAGQSQFVQDIQAQIQQGADPSAIAPVTAVGRPIEDTLQCRTGFMSAEGDIAAMIGKIPYTSTLFENVRYGQLMTNPVSYFVQYEHQMVTLTKIDRLPPDAHAALQRAVNGMVECESEPLVIEAMLSSEYLRDRDLPDKQSM